MHPNQSKNRLHCSLLHVTETGQLWVVVDFVSLFPLEAGNFDAMSRPECTQPRSQLGKRPWERGWNVRCNLVRNMA